MNFRQITIEVGELAKKVGDFIRKESRIFSYSKVEYKNSRSDLVSFVDKESEKKIVQGLKKLIPEAGFITEEGTTCQGQKEYTWIVDPLDGTTNFVHGIPNYCVSIGLMYDMKIVLGVVYEITNNECFYAWKGGGAYLNGQLIKVASTSVFSDCVLATGFPYHEFERLDAYFKILNELMKNTQGLRRMGSAATDMAYVACGRYGGYFEYNINSYDIAAGVILIQEAGGTVTDFSGEQNFLFGRQIVTGGGVHKELLRTIRKFW